MATWDINTPTDRDPIRFVDEELRNMKDYLEDALSREHNFPVTGMTHKVGFCSVVQIVDSLSDLDIVESGLGYVKNDGKLYSKNNGNYVEVGKRSYIPSGTKAVFVQDSAPSGWSLLSVDGLVYITNNGSNGGSARSGSWTISGVTAVSHTHTVTTPDHKHPTGFLTGSYMGIDLYKFGTGDTTLSSGSSIPLTSGSGTGNYMLTSGVYSSEETTSGGSGTLNIDHDASWRPRRLNCILCEKD